MTGEALTSEKMRNDRTWTQPDSVIRAADRYASSRPPGTIYDVAATPFHGPTASGLHRVIAFGIAGAAISVLLVALSIQPNQRGISTHAQLGLAPCQFEARTGMPCMTCGMTTSFAWFVRGNLLASLYVQPMGTIMALLTVMAVWTGGYVAFTGRPLHRLLFAVPLRYTVVPLILWGIVAWAWKIFIHMGGIDGWR